MRQFIGLLVGAVLSFACAAAVHAHDYTIGDLRITHPWAKPSLKGVPNGAAYMAITNTGDSDETLVSVSGDISGAVELHTMSMTDGVMRMRRLEGGVPLPAGETTALAPGGKHIMLIELKRPLDPGISFDLTLTFENAGPHRINVKVSENPPEGSSANGS